MHLLSELVTKGSVIKITNEGEEAIISSCPSNVIPLASGLILAIFRKKGQNLRFFFQPDGTIEAPTRLTAYRYQGPKLCFVPLTELVEAPATALVS